MRRTGALALCILGSLVGCAETPPEEKPSGGPVELQEAEISFGEVLVGESAERILVLENKGDASIWLETMELPAGFRVEPPVFEIAAGGTTEVAVIFAPTRIGESGGAVAFRSLESLLEAVATVSGEGVAESFAMEGVLEFGVLDPGSTKESKITIESRVDRPLLLDLRLDGDPAFTLDEESLVLGPREAKSVSISFRPEASREYAALVVASACPSCPTRITRLVGEGRGVGVHVSPRDVQFGPVPVGRHVEKTVLFRNDLDVAISATASLHPSDSAFAIEGDTRVGPLLPGEEGVFLLRFSPTTSGVHSATLRLLGPDGPWHEGTLDGIGGGPLLGVTPEALDFGEIVVGASAHRTLRLENVGDAAFPLFLEAVSLEVDEGPETFSVRPPSLPLDLSEPLDLPLWFLPREAGEQSGTLVLRTSVPALPEIRVPVRAGAYTPTPCTLVAEKEELRFGLVGLPAQRTQEIFIKNAGFQPCLLTHTRVAGEAAGHFSIVRPLGEARRLENGQGLFLRVEVDTEGSVDGERLEARLEVQHGESDAVGVFSIPMRATATTTPLVNPPPTFKAIPPTPRGLGFVTSAEFPTGTDFRLALSPDSSNAFEFPASQRLEKFDLTCPSAPCSERVQLAFLPKDHELHRARLEVTIEGFDEPAYFDFEAAGTEPCGQCGWPQTVGCGSTLFLEVDEVASFSDPWPHECNYSLGPSSEHGSRRHTSQGLLHLDEPHACSGTYGLPHPDIWGFIHPLHNLRVQPDGRAAACSRGTNVRAPLGISVVLMPVTMEPLEHRLFVLRASDGGDPENRAHWFDPFLTCAGPEGEETVHCLWQPAGEQGDVRIVSMGAGRGLMARIPRPVDNENYFFSYYFESPSPHPAASLVNFYIYCNGTRMRQGLLQLAPNTVLTFAAVPTTPQAACSSVVQVLAPPIEWPYRVEGDEP